ncbi:MAG: tetratricopeptide repeat protein [Myxacorys californica WJT36-NPBG1]|nr:tetratricopeptide repeat protein [Myxacorys californica WJT36-NPBG1]
MARMARFAVGLVSASVLAGAIGLPSRAADLTQQLNSDSKGAQRTLQSEADREVQLGTQQQQIGQANSAIASWQRAIALYHRIGDVEAQGRVYDLLGYTYARVGQLANADDAFRRRLAIARDNQDVQGQIYALNNIGTILLQRRSLLEAQKTFAEALNVSQQIRHTVGQGISLSNLGLVSYLQGQYQQAIGQLEQARTFRGQSKDLIGEANTLSNLGDAYQAIADYRAAYIAHRQALFLGQQGSNRPTQFRALDGMIASYRGLGQDSNLTAALNERLALASTDNDSMQVLTSLKAIAQYHRQKGDMLGAKNYYEQALEIARSLNATEDREFLITQIGALNSRKFLR